MGRPKLPKDEVRKVFPIRLNAKEREIVKQAAKAAGLGPAEWARKKLLS
jgi:hypothetical protein